MFISASVFNTPSVKPVIVSWSELLVASGFGVAGPFWDGHFAGFLQESSEGDDEVGLVDIFDADHFGAKLVSEKKCKVFKKNRHFDSFS